MTLKLPHLFRRKQVFSRSAVRYDCAIDCDILLTDSMVGYEGRLINVSAGGAMFRPRLAYLMERRDVPVSLRLGGESIAGQIVATNQAGFGIRFDRPVDDAALHAFLVRHGGAATCCTARRVAMC